MGKRTEAFKGLPGWAKVVCVLIALSIGGCVYLAAQGVQGKAKLDDAVTTCKNLVRSNGGEVVGDPYSVDEPGAVSVTGHAQTAKGFQGFDCAVYHDGSSPDVEFTSP